MKSVEWARAPRHSRLHRGPCIAGHGPRSIRVYTSEDRPNLIATIRAVDHGSIDDLLRAYGWKRVGAWMRSDDFPTLHLGRLVPEGHRVVTVERVDRDADANT